MALGLAVPEKRAESRFLCYRLQDPPAPGPADLPSLLKSLRGSEGPSPRGPAIVCVGAPFLGFRTAKMRQKYVTLAVRSMMAAAAGLHAVNGLQYTV